VTDRVPRWLGDLLQRGLDPEPARRLSSMRAVVVALERGLGRRRRIVMAAAAIVAIAAAVATATLGYARGRDAIAARCPEPDLGAAWAGPRKLLLAVAFHVTGLAYAPSAWRQVERTLDQFAGRWRSQRRAACVAFEVQRTDDRELHDRRLSCLDHRRLMFEAIVDRFGEANRTTVDQVSKLLASLPDVEACARPEAAAWPVGPIARTQLANHFRELAQASSLAAAGQPAQAALRTASLVRAARALGGRRAEADATYLAGHVAGLLGRDDEAVTQVESALWIAEATRHDELVVTAACELLFLIGQRQRRPADAQRLVELARAAAERVGSTQARARAARAIGNLAATAGQLDVAEHELRRARALVDLLSPPEPMFGAVIDVDLANLDTEGGRHSAAEARLRRATAISARELGELHPTHAQGLNNLGNTLLDLQRYPEAARLFDQAISILERSLGPHHPDVAVALANSVDAHLATGDLARATRLVVRSIAILEAYDATHPLLASSLTTLARARRLEGQLAEAAQLHARALAIRRHRLGAHHPKVVQSLVSLAAIALASRDVRAADSWCRQATQAITGSDAGYRVLRGQVEVCRGEVELASGERARATASLERALELHRGGEDLAVLAEAQFALARALPASATARAIELARAARAGFERERALRAPDIARVNAWLARRAPEPAARRRSDTGAR
jgi:eukaryotic-like serine/threonine-protein kinase